MTFGLALIVVVPIAIAAGVGECPSTVQPHEHSTQCAGGGGLQDSPPGDRSRESLGELVKGRIFHRLVPQ
jgi:hypothetical protein